MTSACTDTIEVSQNSRPPPYLLGNDVEAPLLHNAMKKEIEAAAADLILRKGTGIGHDTPPADNTWLTRSQFYMIARSKNKILLLLLAAHYIITSGLILFTYFGPHHKGSWLCKHYLLDLTFLLASPTLARMVCKETWLAFLVKRKEKYPHGLSDEFWESIVEINAFIVLIVVLALSVRQQGYNSASCCCERCA